MKIKQLKEYLNSLPEELDNFDVVYCKAHILDESTSNWAREDMPIDSIVVDQDHEEMCMGKWETIDTMLKMSEAQDNYNNPKPSELQNAEDIKPLADGNYPCLWSGYGIVVRHGDQEYKFTTNHLDKGVRGMNIPAVVIIKNGEVENVTTN